MAEIQKTSIRRQKVIVLEDWLYFRQTLFWYHLFCMSVIVDYITYWCLQLCYITCFVLCNMWFRFYVAD